MNIIFMYMPCERRTGSVSAASRRAAAAAAAAPAAPAPAPVPVPAPATEPAHLRLGHGGVIILGPVLLAGLEALGVAVRELILGGHRWCEEGEVFAGGVRRRIGSHGIQGMSCGSK